MEDDYWDNTFLLLPEIRDKWFCLKSKRFNYDPSNIRHQEVAGFVLIPRFKFTGLLDHFVIYYSYLLTENIA